MEIIRETVHRHPIRRTSYIAPVHERFVRFLTSHAGTLTVAITILLGHDKLIVGQHGIK